MKRRGMIFAVAACTALLAVRAQAQDIGTGYGDDQSVAYYDRDAARDARIRELEAEVAHYRQVAENSLSGGCGACDGGCGSCCAQVPNWFDCCCCGPTWAFSVSGDAWRDFTDVDYGNNFGNRFTLEGTWDLGDSGVRGHLGMGYGLYDYHGRVSFGAPGSEKFSSAEQQVFLTAGAYHRGCCGGDWTWAVSYDFLNDNHYGVNAESIDLHQMRFLVGRMMNACNEFGVWGAFGVQDDDYDGNVTIKTQDQVNLYWRRYWDLGGQTMLYAGLANPNLTFVTPTGETLGGDDLTEVVLGLRGIAPLTCNIGLVGGFQYVIPSASGGVNRVGTGTIPASFEENWNVTVGIMWVRGCSLPVLPTADNGWMSKRVRVAETP